MTESESNQDKIPPKQTQPTEQVTNYDWRDPSKPRNPEDDGIVDGWRRRADGTFEKVEEKEAEQ
ncbi:hypothetical protein [Aulosira sp. FACHB-615]|uniref:hypothetical protein n=1 Tax=Aulosira sp. FACHB-615 TaxID=2692777 RepID=UPI001686BCE4|nr:hypothetical protein [Aulosira sp. FACHB-615]MBD2492685.1 hypothetical protein [Aulosira sp. FACHB-615]